jgi:hypothetical protein
VIAWVCAVVLDVARRGARTYLSSTHLGLLLGPMFLLSDPTGEMPFGLTLVADVVVALTAAGLVRAPMVMARLEDEPEPWPSPR